MEGMNLAKLEAVVEKMLKSMQELKRDNADLQAQLAARNSKIADLEAEISSMASTQDEVSSRVSSLLTSIEEWEKVAEPDVHEAQDEIRDEMNDRKGGGLFSVGE